MQTYSQIQYLVKNEIQKAIEKDQQERVFTAYNLPSHAHTGTDSQKVDFLSLQNVQQYVMTSRVTLTSAQILALHTTPVQLIPQPGNRSVIIVNSVTARLVYGTTTYVGANDVEIRATDGSGVQVAEALPATFLNSVSSGYFTGVGFPSVIYTPVPGGSGINGRIVAAVGTANPTLGNGTLTIVLNYLVVPFAA